MEWDIKRIIHDYRDYLLRVAYLYVKNQNAEDFVSNQKMKRICLCGDK